MANFHVPNGAAVPLRRRPGSELTLTNVSGTDVYMDKDPARLNQTAVGVVPQGTRLVNTTGFIQFTEWPGLMWFRAAAATNIEVLP